MAVVRFIDRLEELDFLEQQYRGRDASLVIVYGRRRLGKTSLLQHFIADKPSLYFLASEETERENIEDFKRMVAEFTHNTLLEKADHLTWYDIFSELASASKNQRIILVIDEFQYLCMTNAAFASIFQKVWDTMLKECNIMVILCGSLISMMESQTLSYASPLYGRRTGQCRLKQIPFRHYQEFFPLMDKDLSVQYYAVTGGVPRYIEAFSDEQDLFQNIEQFILKSESFLYEEPVFLLQKEVNELGSFFSILKAIASGGHKLSAIATRLEVNQSKLTRYLAVLRQLDLVERRIPITEEYPEKSKKGLYFIKDNFIQFWFQFVYPYRSYLEIGNTEIAMNAIREKFIQNHVSYVYEQICMEKLWQLSASGEIPVHFSKAGAWWNANQEIDIAALNEETHDMVFCECKYHDKPIGISVLNDLIGKSKHVTWHANTRKEHFVLFSRHGFDKELTALAREEDSIYLVPGC
jgi:AAA+ ATPase superfamily predicted ATPase